MVDVAVNGQEGAPPPRVLLQLHVLEVQEVS